MLELMKELLGIINDNSKDVILNHYITKSQNAIKRYSNIDEIIEDLYPSVVDLAIHFYKNRNNEGVTSQTQGSRSKSFESGIPESIKTTLPLPKIKVVG